MRTIQVQPHGYDEPLILNVELHKESDTHREWAATDDENRFKILFVEKPLGLIDEINTEPYDATVLSDGLREQLESVIDAYIERLRSGADASSDDGEYPPTVPYDPKKIKIRSERWSITTIKDLLEFEDINLSPDFQREFVWDNVRKSRLIESLLLGIPIPAFYLAETEKGKYHVVDGLQRFTTIFSFLNNKFRLRYLEYLNHGENKLEGFYYQSTDKLKGLDRSHQKQILLTQLTINIIEAASPTQVKYDVFRRINTGGRPLNSQEIRNCLSDAKVRETINQLAKSEEFIAATGNSVTTTRMDAQEYVLRFIGFWNDQIRKRSNWQYSGNMRSFLDEAIITLNNEGGLYHDEIHKAFNNGMKNSFHLFGWHCFRKYLPQELIREGRRQLINKSLFTTWSVLLSPYDPKVIAEKNKENSFTRILADKLLEDTDFFNSVSYRTNDKYWLNLAFERTSQIIKNNLNL